MSKHRSSTQIEGYRTVQKSERLAQLHCTNGCGKGKPGASFCHDCGTKLPRAVAKAAQNESIPLAAPAFLAKGAAPSDPPTFNVDFYDPDPAVRERAWNEQYNRVANKSAAPDPADQPFLWDINSSDPNEREMAWRQAFAARNEGR